MDRLPVQVVRQSDLGELSWRLLWVLAQLLDPAAVGEIVRDQLGEDAEESFCAAVSELTGGNPLFTREPLAAARQERLAARDASVSALERLALAAVGTSVLGRLRQLGPESVMARAVAVLGAGAEVMVSARLADLDPALAELAADCLVAVQILARSRPLEFFHPLIGAAKTAKGHLSRVCHKLGITGRGQLPDALAGPLDDTRTTSGAMAAIS